MPFHGKRTIPDCCFIVLVCNIIPDKPSLLHLAEIQPLVERIFKMRSGIIRSEHTPVTETQTLP